MQECKEGIKGLIKIFIATFTIGILSSSTVGAPKGIAWSFAMVMTMLYCTVYIATKAAYKDVKRKERGEASGRNEIIDRH